MTELATKHERAAFNSYGHAIQGLWESDEVQHHITPGTAYEAKYLLPGGELLGIALQESFVARSGAARLRRLVLGRELHQRFDATLTSGKPPKLKLISNHTIVEHGGITATVLQLNEMRVKDIQSTSKKVAAGTAAYITKNLPRRLALDGMWHDLIDSRGMESGEIPDDFAAALCIGAKAVWQANAHNAEVTEASRHMTLQTYANSMPVSMRLARPAMLRGDERDFIYGTMCIGDPSTDCYVATLGRCASAPRPTIARAWRRSTAMDNNDTVTNKFSADEMNTFKKAINEIHIETPPAE